MATDLSSPLPLAVTHASLPLPPAGKAARRAGEGAPPLRVLALLFAGIALPSIAGADAMRCGSKLINEGDTQDKVLQYCGEPTEQSRTYIVRKPRFEVGGQEYSFNGEEEVPVDLWTYDFGPNKLMRRVRMVAGKVESIETLEHGTNR
jgi:hypothetical protein